MHKISGIIFFISSIATFILFAGNASSLAFELEEQLAEDIQDFHLEDFSHIEAAFILSGANQPDSLQFYLNWYQDLVSSIRNYNLDPFAKAESAAKVFSYLHSSWLITYKEEATTLINVVNQKRFNCVAGTILYNLICEEFGWSTEAFETPTHTYTIFPNFTENITVENTTPMGFNIMQNLKLYSKHLLNFYPKKQAYNIGLDRIYAYENSKGRKIDNTELLGLLAYNRAYFAMQVKDYKLAYHFVLLAQKFNKDSRSNVNFEIGLYYKWGKLLIDQNRFHDAFQVYADAYYRYWENNDFSHNCIYSFFKALAKDWENKNWTASRELVDDMSELEILKDMELDRLKMMMQNWVVYFYQQGNNEKVKSVMTKLDGLFPGDAQIKKLRESLLTNPK